MLGLLVGKGSSGNMCCGGEHQENMLSSITEVLVCSREISVLCHVPLCWRPVSCPSSYMEVKIEF